MRTLNRCRIYLKVITLSDITTADGTRKIPSVKKGYQIPARISTLMWPNQGKPNSAEWKIWEASLSHFESRGNSLDHSADGSIILIKYGSKQYI